MTTRWAYLGPEGTFTEQAALSIVGREPESVELVPSVGVSAALDAVRNGSVRAAVVPMENSVEGAVPLTQDELTHGDELMITAEAFVAVTFDLLIRPGTDPGTIRTIGSHPHGHAQVRDWLAVNLPGREVVLTSSTAAAAAAVAAGELDAAAAAPVAGTRLGLVALATDVGLERDAVTRFVRVQKPGEPPAPTGCDRTSLILTVENRPGTLLSVLAEFAGRGINMTRLGSRPTRKKLGEYVFIVEADGHLADPAMTDAVAALIRRGALLRWLGSYPRFEPLTVVPYVTVGTHHDPAVQAVTRLLSGGSV